MLTEITIEVHCLRPRWADKEGTIYRLFLNNELMTERTWVWSMKSLIRERFAVDIEKDTDHNLRLEVIRTKPTAMTQLILKNLLLNRHEYQGLYGQGEEINFKL